ncbi:glycosyltransferase family A protein [Vibrio splendidus]
MENNIQYSYIIPTYNRSKTIIKTINSVLNQDRHDYEVIIVDDGSTDNTKGKISDILSDRRVTYLYQKNSGVSVARNFGEKNATGKYLIFLDSDDLINKNQLEVFDSILDKDIVKELDIGVFFTNYEYYYNNDGEPENNIPRENLVEGVYNNFFLDFILGTQPFLVGCVCIRRDIFKNSNKFLPDRSFGEDQSLWVDLACDEYIYSSNEFTFKYRQLTEDSLMKRKVDSLPPDINNVHHRLISGEHRRVEAYQLRNYLRRRYISFLKLAIKDINLSLFSQVLKGYISLLRKN